jgi:2-methylisocitrate lyase-like PEP mutase family enzyme
MVLQERRVRRMNTKATLRKLLTEKGIIIAPGCYDAFSARILGDMGFKAVYVTGFGMEASILGTPDIGLTTMSEFVRRGRNIAEAVGVPVIVDSDVGFGGVLNVYRTVKEFDHAGVAAIHIEDQTLPKKCPGIAPPTVIEMEEMVAKIKAAKRAVEDTETKDFVIVARSDFPSRPEEKMDALKKRFSAYLEAGADLIFPAGDPLPRLEEIQELAKEFKDKLFTISFVGLVGLEKEMYMNRIATAAEFADAGAKVVVYPLLGLQAAGHAVQQIYAPLLKGEEPPEVECQEKCLGIREVFNILKVPEWLDLEKTVTQA